MVIGQVSNRTINRGKNHESCNDHLQRDRCLDGDSHRYAVGSTANRASIPPMSSGKQLRKPPFTDAIESAQPLDAATNSLLFTLCQLPLHAWLRREQWSYANDESHNTRRSILFSQRTAVTLRHSLAEWRFVRVQACTQSLGMSTVASTTVTAPPQFHRCHPARMDVNRPGLPSEFSIQRRSAA